MRAEVFCRDLGTVDYKECWDLQKRLFEGLIAFKCAEEAERKERAEEPGAQDGGERGSTEGQRAQAGEESDSTEEQRAQAGDAQQSIGIDGDEGRQWLLLVEHPAVYTLGKSGHESNLLVDSGFLKSIGASYYHIDRGGDITFHGAGQLVGYPILDLERVGMGLREYIGAIEQTVIDTVGEYGISAGRVAGASGVWITEGGTLRKICAIGVRSSRFVTMHGFALNVNTDLRYFDYINPCGFTDRGVTSIAKEVAQNVDMNDVKQRLATRFEENLNVKIKY